MARVRPEILALACPMLFVPPLLAQGGEDAAAATPIDALPYADTGTTLGFVDDVDEVCPYTGSTSPDVYYVYTPSVSEFVTIELCNSSYDTKVYVHDADGNLVFTAGGSTACNDDACSDDNGNRFRSRLDCVLLPAGQPYFVIVDGWNGDAGDYVLEVTPATSCIDPCILDCSPGATIEGEPCLFGEPRPDDTFNGGCNSSPAVFGTIACGESICGDGYFDGAFRDTDWYEVDATGHVGSTSFTFSGTAEFDLILARIPCGSWNNCACLPVFDDLVLGDRCDWITFTTANLPPAIYTFFVAANFTDIVDCGSPFGSRYEVTLECAEAPPPCPWDFDTDGNVDFGDLLEILSHWGPCPG